MYDDDVINDSLYVGYLLSYVNLNEGFFFRYSVDTNEG